MGCIEFNENYNSISLLQRRTYKNDLSEQPVKNSDIILLCNKKNNIIGIKFENFLSELELKGFKAEQLFKKILDQNNIPALYIGQGPSGISFSNTLKNNLKSNRPDFLVNFPDVGNLFFDVKCRRKVGFTSNESKYFYLFRSEIEALINLHEALLIPVWIAFLDTEAVQYNDNQDMNLDFYLVPVSILKKYKDMLHSYLTEREQTMLSIYRIPQCLQIKITKEIYLKFGIPAIDEDLIKELANAYKGLIRRIEDEIKMLIRQKKIFKSNVYAQILELLPSTFKVEVNNILEKLIDEGVIIYQPRESLKLLGEES